MKKEQIKPIPKNIIKAINKHIESEPKPYHNVNFYSYFAKYGKDLVLVLGAVKTRRNNRSYKQVAVHPIRSEKCFVRDMEFYSIAGYVVGFHDMGLSKYPKWFEDGKWYEADGHTYLPHSYCVNPS